MIEVMVKVAMNYWRIGGKEILVYHAVQRLLVFALSCNIASEKTLVSDFNLEKLAMRCRINLMA